MKRSKRNLWILTGLLFITAALCLTGYNLYDQMRAEQSARQAAERLLPLIQEAGETAGGQAALPDCLMDPDKEMPVVTVDGRDYIGILQIPSLKLRLPVISRWDYDALRAAPCRYTGSAYTDDLVIAAHNYPAHFGTLKELEPGAKVFFTDMEGNRFRYEVASVETLAPSAVEEMVSSGCALTLFSCTPGGQSRVAARCERVSGES